MATQKRSRAYRNCERILKLLIERYGPTAKISEAIVQKIIREVAGHDPRTINNYMNSLCDFQMLLEQTAPGRGYTLFSLNIVKVADYRQLTMKDVEAAANVETVEK